ncbi:hypothetical protein pb186bvf_002359 [Paramecium bursaria]
MFLSRVGMIAMYAKKRSDRLKKPPHQFLIDHQEKFKQQIARKKKNVYAYSQTTYGAFIIGLLFVTAGIFLTYLLLKMHDSDLSMWWRYLIVFFIAGLGCLFIIQTERVSIEIHKSHKILIINRMQPFLFLKNDTIVKDLEQLEIIRVVKKGHQAYQNSTIYFTIEFIFKDSKESVLEFNYLRQAKLKYAEIMV